MQTENILVVVLAVCMAGCSSGNGGSVVPPEPNVTVTVSGSSTLLNTGADRTFAATVNGTSNTAVNWSVIEAGGGSISQAGVYTAPLVPGTYRVKAVSQANTRASGKAVVPVIIPEGNVSGTQSELITMRTLPTITRRRL